MRLISWSMSFCDVRPVISRRCPKVIICPWRIHFPPISQECSLAFRSCEQVSFELALRSLFPSLSMLSICILDANGLYYVCHVETELDLMTYFVFVGFYDLCVSWNAPHIQVNYGYIWKFDGCNLLQRILTWTNSLHNLVRWQISPGC
jgi:hypothetical protein